MQERATSRMHGRFILITGADGTGKTTVMDQLATLNYRVLEPTMDPEAQSFKHHAYDAELTTKLINERRELFLKLNQQMGRRINELTGMGVNVASTNHELVTQLYHEQLHATIDPDYMAASQVKEWLRSGTARPDLVIILHASMAVIEQRLRARAAADPTEGLNGFNAITFLTVFQSALLKLPDLLQGEGVASLKIDTTHLNPSETFKHIVAITNKESDV